MASAIACASEPEPVALTFVTGETIPRADPTDVIRMMHSEMRTWKVSKFIWRGESNPFRSASSRLAMQLLMCVAPALAPADRGWRK